MWQQNDLHVICYNFYHLKKALSLKQEDLRDMFKKASMNVFTSIVLFPEPLSSTPSTS